MLVCRAGELSERTVMFRNEATIINAEELRLLDPFAQHVFVVLVANNLRQHQQVHWAPGAT